jgi:hypothetical protein
VAAAIQGSALLVETDPAGKFLLPVRAAEPQAVTVLAYDPSTALYGYHSEANLPPRGAELEQLGYTLAPGALLLAHRRTGARQTRLGGRPAPVLIRTSSLAPKLGTRYGTVTVT